MASKYSMIMSCETIQKHIEAEDWDAAFATLSWLIDSIESRLVQSKQIPLQASQILSSMECLSSLSDRASFAAVKLKELGIKESDYVKYFKNIMVDNFGEEVSDSIQKALKELERIS